jgi:hypothetical protein
MKQKLIFGFKSISGTMYLKLMLQHIKVAKQLFILHVEQGTEVFILENLSQDDLPMSLRYYDPILKIVQEDCNMEKKDVFLLKSQNTFKEIE